MGLAAVISSAAVLALTPQQKAALVVVSGLPAPAGVGGVIVQRHDRNVPRPPGALVFADQEATARSAHITGRGASTNIAFRAGKAGDYIYFCSLPGHQLAGMQGQFLVTPQAPPQTLVEADISKLSTDLPPPIAKRAPQTIHVDLTTVELEGRLAEGLSHDHARGLVSHAGKLLEQFELARYLAAVAFD